MVFTTAAGSSDTAEVFEVVQGSHVFCSEGECFTEWADLTSEQQRQLVHVSEYLSDAFVQARDMMVAVGLKAVGSDQAVGLTA